MCCCYNYICFIFFNQINKRERGSIFIIYRPGGESSRNTRERVILRVSFARGFRQQPADFPLSLGALRARPDTGDDWQLSLASVCARHRAPPWQTHRLAPAINCPPAPKKLHFNVFFCFKLIISWPFSCFWWPFVGVLTPGVLTTSLYFTG